MATFTTNLNLRKPADNDTVNVSTDIGANMDLIDAAMVLRQPLDSDLTAIAALSTTAFGRALLALADAAAGRTALGLGTAATAASGDFQPIDADLTAIAGTAVTDYGRAVLALIDAAGLRTHAELGTAATSAAADFQPVDADLTAIAALTTTAFGRSVLEAANAAALRTLAGVGTMATEAAADYVTKALYDANSVLIATSDNTPLALTVAASRIVGRKASGDIDDITGAEAAAILAGEVFKQAQETNAQTGTTYTLVAGDAGKLVTLSNAGAITLTVPQDSDATIAIGTYVDLYQLGAGQVTVAAGSGATLRVSGLTAKARAQYSRMAVQKVSANTWNLFGDLSSS